MPSWFLYRSYVRSVNHELLGSTNSSGVHNNIKCDSSLAWRIPAASLLLLSRWSLQAPRVSGHSKHVEKQYFLQFEMKSNGTLGSKILILTGFCVCFLVVFFNFLYPWDKLCFEKASYFKKHNMWSYRCVYSLCTHAYSKSKMHIMLLHCYSCIKTNIQNNNYWYDLSCTVSTLASSFRVPSVEALVSLLPNQIPADLFRVNQPFHTAVKSFLSPWNYSP